MLQGRLEITVGENVSSLDAGDSLHFNSGIPHRMENIGDQTAELIVVIYNP
jgi:quercetin dioxygenase-like cupin family protein